MLLRIISHFPDLVPADAVLHEFGEHRFDLIDHARRVDPPLQDLQIVRAARSHPPQQQALADIVQDSAPVLPRLLEDAVGQAAEAQHVNIHQDPGRMVLHQVPLGLHGILLRHDHDIFCTVPAPGTHGDLCPVDQKPAQEPALACSGRAKTECIAHRNLFLTHRTSMTLQLLLYPTYHDRAK